MSDTVTMFLIGAVAVVAVAVLPAQASIPVLNVVAKPTGTTERGMPTGFQIKFDLGGNEKIKDLVQRLPRGFEANNDQPLCPVGIWRADMCPANTLVGTSTAFLTVGPEAQQVPGRIYYLVPESGALPALGIILDAPPPFKKAFQMGEVKLNPQLGVLETTIRNFPQTAETMVGVQVPIRIDGLDVQLKDTFFRNPRTCTPATVQLIVTSYEDPNSPTSGQSSYTPTGCPPPDPGRCEGRRATISGTGKSENLKGTKGRDVIVGRGGNDVIKGLGGNDTICGGAGKDRILGGAGKDFLLGNAGNDTLLGGAGSDRVRGAGGRDVERP